jgi:mono/diheme cytochrome c family protein
VDGDGDFSVNALDFCTTPDCVTAAQATLPAGSVAVPVPFSAATDGRDHWLSAGEPHCADCHQAPFVEQSGNINAYPPFNYPRKASLMRYSKGHQNISCQGCHESIHGLYPVTPLIDTTSYAQAAALNHDGSHGPLKCGTCHEVDRNGIPTWMSGVKYNGNRIRTYDDAVAWMHTFTDEVSPLEPEGVCENCHGDRSNKIAENSGKWLRHSFEGRIGRQLQDKAEIAAFGHVAGDPDPDGIPGNGDDRTAQDIADIVCSSCHSLQGGPAGAFLNQVADCTQTWKSHNIDGRVSEKVWEFVSISESGSTCGW